MREAYPTERAVGMTYYASDADGIGGRLRATPDDFRVREIEDVDFEPLDADPDVFDHLVVRATLRNWDTNAFARAVSNRLGISRERVSWAGTKDKRAVTTQLVSIRGVDPGDLPAIEDADVEPVGRLGRPLRFGDLAGNDFEIVVTDPDRPGNVTPITDELRAFGGGTTAVPNYFGQQRFGSRRPITHEVGLAIVRGDWKGAVMAYVGNPSEAEPTDAREARQFIEKTEDWAAGLERMPDHLHHERAMLHRLVESESDTEDEDAFRAALETVPTNLQQLFVHAAQSYVFNRILSERFRRGLPFDRAVASDVVCFADVIDGLVVPDPERSQRVTDREVDAVNRHTRRGRAFVTAPLVGTETDLGEGDPGAIERAVLDDVGIAPDDFDLPGEFGSTETRRPMLLRTAFEIDSDPLRFGFALPKGSYATVALREYLKTPPEAME